MKALLVGVSIFAITALSAESAKTAPSPAIHDVEIFMKKDAACKWPPLAAAFLHNKNTTSRIRATTTVTNNPARSDDLNQERQNFWDVGLRPTREILAMPSSMRS